MMGWHRTIGMVIGLILGCGILSLTGTREATRSLSGPILSECDGRMSELVIHYVSSAKQIVSSVYPEFVGALDPDVTVDVVCPDNSAFEDFVRLVGEVRCRLRPILVHHPITTWSRDRWVALEQPSLEPGAVTVLSPRSEAGSAIWPARAGDERVGQDLAAGMAAAVHARRSALFFDGGDFLADSENVFVAPRVLQRNIQQTVESREAFLAVLAGEFRRRIILLEEAPDHHAAMFMASAGNNVVLVGDPRLGRPLAPAHLNLPGGPDFTSATQHLFDAVADQCAREGYEVHRIPVVPGRDGRSYLTYVNVLLDRAGTRHIAYVPVYAGAEALNAAAREVWEGLGFEVRPIDCTATYRHFGCLHCLVNVLRRTGEP